MRILYFITDADIGGAEKLLEAMAVYKANDDELSLVVLMDRGSLSVNLEKAFSSVRYLGFSRSSLNLFAMVRALEREIREFRPNVVSSNLYHADLVALLARTKVTKVSTLHTQGFGPADHPLTKLIARIVGLFSSRFAAVIPTSDSADAAEFARKYRYKNLVEPIRNTSVLTRERLYQDENKTFLSLARFHPVKGHAALFAAFSAVADIHPDWKLLCAGPGVSMDNPTIVELARESGLSSALERGQLEFVGSVVDARTVLIRSNALVISSLYGETFPLVGIEATSAGIPVITTDVGSCAIFTVDPRYVVRPGDPASLATALLSFIDLQPSERESLAYKTFEEAEKRSNPRKTVEQYRSVYFGILNQP